MRSQRRIILLVVIFLLPLSLGAQQPSSSGFTILLSNDDGYDAPGLRALIEALRPIGEIIVAAPVSEQSGKGHSITIREPLMVSERKQPNAITWYAIEAPPATCVRLAVEALLSRRPNVVISGINRGENLGTVVYYSGTVGAAREAAIVGLPAIAVSMRGNDAKDYAAAAAYIRELVEQLRAKQMLKPGLFLNVNVPAGERRGVRVTRLSTKPGHDSFQRRVNPRGQLYFWSTWKPLEDGEEGSDVWAFVRGFITLTPMGLDVTAVHAIDSLHALDLQPAGVSVPR